MNSSWFLTMKTCPMSFYTKYSAMKFYYYFLDHREIWLDRIYVYDRNTFSLHISYANEIRNISIPSTLTRRYHYLLIYLNFYVNISDLQWIPILYFNQSLIDKSSFFRIGTWSHCVMFYFISILCPWACLFFVFKLIHFKY